jgi:limonene-1,2-epoxide hydrolase
MAEHATTVDIARAFTEAWTSHDMDSAARYLAEDVVFDGPVNHTRGKNAYIEALNRFAQAVTELKIRAAFGDDSQALIMYPVQSVDLYTATIKCSRIFGKCPALC